MKEKPLKIKHQAVMPGSVLHPTLTFVLILKVFWAILAWWLLIIVSILWVIYVGIIIAINGNFIGVDPLGTYNQDEHPLDAYEQDMGIKHITKDTPPETFQDKLRKKMNN